MDTVEKVLGILNKVLFPDEYEYLIQSLNEEGILAGEVLAKIVEILEIERVRKIKVDLSYSFILFNSSVDVLTVESARDFCEHKDYYWKYPQNLRFSKLNKEVGRVEKLGLFNCAVSKELEKYVNQINQVNWVDVYMSKSRLYISDQFKEFLRTGVLSVSKVNAYCDYKSIINALNRYYKKLTSQKDLLYSDIQIQPYKEKPFIYSISGNFRLEGEGKNERKINNFRQKFKTVEYVTNDLVSRSLYGRDIVISNIKVNTKIFCKSFYVDTGNEAAMLTMNKFININFDALTELEFRYLWHYLFHGKCLSFDISTQQLREHIADRKQEYVKDISEAYSRKDKVQLYESIGDLGKEHRLFRDKLIRELHLLDLPGGVGEINLEFNTEITPKEVKELLIGGDIKFFKRNIVYDLLVVESPELLLEF